MILSPKHLPRLISTIRLFTNYGLRDFANRQGLLNLEGTSLDEEADSSGESREKAKAFRERLVELGPAYIKLGQILSTRADLRCCASKAIRISSMHISRTSSLTLL